VSSPTQAEGAALRLLLIEDNPGDARLTRELLRDSAAFAFELVHASTFLAALDLLKQQEFDVILLDLTLGDATGIEAVQRLHIHNPLMPVVVLSGLEDESVATAALQQGAQDYLVKGQGDGFLICRSIRYAVERKRIEVQLIAAKIDAEAASRAKSQFLATMSHELRTPLNAIIGFSELMEQEFKGPLHPDYREYTRDIRDSGLHLLNIINDILDLSKIEMGGLTLNEQPFDVAGAVDASLRCVRDQAAAAGLELTVDLPPNLPPLNGDERMVKQMLLNLLSNAIKFTEKGGSVHLSTQVSPGGAMFISVRDTGIGMSAADIPRAFQPFVQIDSRLQRKYQGTGLGLPLCRSIVELHGGYLDVESTVGVGTTIAIYFPAHRSEKPSRRRRERRTPDLAAVPTAA
jgi:signal transduction histidine kinase